MILLFLFEQILSRCVDLGKNYDARRMVVMLKIAIIGSGLTGLLLAEELRTLADVTVFEKARGVGGRLATRYSGVYQFDHGSPYFAAEDSSFQTLVNSWIQEGVVEAWRPRVLQEHHYYNDKIYYVGAPKMNALPKYLARDLHILLNTEVMRIQSLEHSYTLEDKNLNSHGPFDWVISTAPYLQSQRLLEKYMPAWTIKMEPCYALMLGYTESFQFDWDMQEIAHGCLEKIILNHQKPKRDAHSSVVVYSKTRWTQDVIEKDLAWVSSTMLDALKAYIPQQPEHIGIHLWRYARARSLLSPKIFFDAKQKLIAGGDWSSSKEVEGAYQACQLIMQGLREYL